MKQPCARETSQSRTNISHEVYVVAQGLNSIEARDQRKWNIAIFGHLLPKEDVCLKVLCTEIVFTREERKRVVDEQWTVNATLHLTSKQFLQLLFGVCRYQWNGVLICVRVDAAQR